MKRAHRSMTGFLTLAAAGLIATTAQAAPNRWTISSWGDGHGSGGGYGGGNGSPDIGMRYGTATLHDYAQGNNRTSSSKRLAAPSSSPRDRHEPAGIDYDASGTLYSLSTRSEVQLYQVNQSSGAMTPLLNPPLNHAGIEGDLAYNPIDGMFYASVPTGGAALDMVLQINASSGVVTPVGSFATDDLSGLAIDSTGAIYGIDSHGGGNAELIKFVWSGPILSAVSYGSLGISFGSMLGMDFDGNDDLYAMSITGKLYEIPTVAFSSPALRSPVQFRIDDVVTGLAWTPTPEPGSLAMFLIGGAILVSRRVRGK